MNRKTFIFMFVAWYCVNTVNGAPISFENKLKCDNRRKTDEIKIQMNEHQWEEDQAGDLNIDSTFTRHAFPKRKKRQTNNDQSNVIASSAPETTIVPDPLNITTQIDADEPSTELSSQPKDATDFTISAEYKRAQENLLSASEQIKDDQVAPKDNNLSDDKSLLNPENLSDGNNEAIQPQTDSTNPIPSPTTPSVPGETNDLDASVTPILKETQETVLVGADKISAKSDDSVESGTLTTAVDIVAATPGKTTETKLTTPDTTVTSSNTPGDSEEPTEEKLNGIVSVTPKVDNSQPSGTSIDGTGLNTVGNALTTVSGDTTENKISAAIIDPVKRDEVAGLEETTEHNLNAVVTEPVKVEKTDGDKSSSSTDTPAISTKPVTTNTPDESHHNATDEKDSVKQDTTRKLDVQPEPEPLGIPKLEAGSVDSISVDTLGTTNNIDIDTPDNKVEKQDASKKHKDVSTTPDNPTTKSDTRKEEHLQNGKDGRSQDFNSNRHESNIYNFDDWDDEFTETNSFDDLIEDPCNCGQTEFSANYDNIEYDPFEGPCEDNCDPTDYPSNYDNVEENPNHSAGSVEYSQPNYDKSRDFFDDFEHENVFDDFINSDIDINGKHENNLRTSLFDHFDDDVEDFDDDVNDLFR